MSGHTFALVDCNNFYASCERVFQPQLIGRPIVILSNNDGCVIARSNEAKAAGVAMGEPYHHIKDKIAQHGIVVFSSNYTLYGNMSRRVMETLAGFTPELEIYSIDEAFLNLAGFEHHGLDPYARQVRATVLQWTGIPVSIGIGTTKTLAKIANRLAKKTPSTGGVLDLSSPDQVDAALASTEVADIWGIGHQWANWLHAQGIHTADQLRRADPKQIRKHMSVVGERIVHELNGISCLPLELVQPVKKGITVSRSFGQYLTELDPINEALIHFVMRSGEKLRRQKLMTRHLTVFLWTNRFSSVHPYYANSAAATLPYPTDYTPELIAHATRLLKRIYRPGFHYKKCGVMLNDLQPATYQRLDLFDTRDQTRQRRLMQAMDALNDDYGARTVRFAGMGNNPAWTMKAEKRSPRFTTHWQEIPTAKTK